MAETSRHESRAITHRSSLVAVREKAFDVLVLHLALLGLFCLLHHLGSKRGSRRIVDLAVDGAILVCRRMRLARCSMGRFTCSITSIWSIAAPSLPDSKLREHAGTSALPACQRDLRL